MAQANVLLSRISIEEDARIVIGNLLKCLPHSSGDAVPGPNVAPASRTAAVKRTRFDGDCEAPAASSNHRDLFGEDYDPAADE